MANLWRTMWLQQIERGYWCGRSRYREVTGGRLPRWRRRGGLSNVVVAMWQCSNVAMWQCSNVVVAERERLLEGGCSGGGGGMVSPMWEGGRQDLWLTTTNQPNLP